MPTPITRRQGLITLSAAAALTAHASNETMPDNFPAQNLDMVRETVTVAHGNFKRLKELVDAHPSLAKAAIDWGFGDWEDALGAASHVGNRQIAEYLIANGARPTLYSAVMLGQLDVVKAFVAAQPGCQRIPGPHSISLLAHAKEANVRGYLESLGDAGAPPATPITAEELAPLAGKYVYGKGDRDQIEITIQRGQLTFTRQGTVSRGLVHLGGLAFRPLGAEAVRIRFIAANTLTIHDPGEVLLAKKL